MATDQRNLPAYLPDDATFRTWGSGIAAQLTAIGLVQASDTGQINWTTATKPTSTFTFAGYEIWRFADSLQATKPVFIKIQYGVDVTVNNPSLRLTVSTATNGAGTSTGQIGTTWSVNSNGSKSAGVTLPSYCAGSSSRLNLFTNVDAASSTFGQLALVERTKTPTGTDTGDGAVTFFTSSGASTSYQMIPFSGSIPTRVGSNMAASLSSAGISSVGSNVAISPAIAPLGKAYFASWAAYLHADLTELQTFQADHLGATRTMMPLGDGLLATGTVQGTTTGHSLAILWE